MFPHPHPRQRQDYQDYFHPLTGMDHRMQPVLTIEGVEYMNDSRAYNVNSTWFALELAHKPVVWIAGCYHPHHHPDYAVLVPLVSKKVKAIVSLGDNRLLADAFSREVDIIVTALPMSEAVKLARYIADRGEMVLLSPACPSFDQFMDYEDRGNQFIEAVKRL